MSTSERACLHVAIIPDGNRRWARAKGLPGTAGHAAAITHERVLAFIEAAKALHLTYLSLWGFSTENWKRNRVEILGIFALLRDAIARLRIDAKREEVRFRWIGRRDRVPKDVREQLEAFEQESAQRTGLTFILCLDYGGRDEIVRAVNRAIANGEQLDEQAFAALLDTAGMPDPDLIIRTSGEQRLSGFLPFQATYAELYFTQKHFPDFSTDDLRAAVEEYSHRQRRYGG